MIASVHLADVGVRSALGILRKAPKPGSIAGLRHADVGTLAPLSASLRKSPSLGRVGLVAFWDSEDAVDRFLSGHRLAEKLAGGWHTKLEPLRAFGSWPGLPTDTPRSRATDYDGQAVVLTLGRFRLLRAVRFFRTSAKAEERVLTAPGLIWATGIARPPFIGTCSLWENTNALSTYAYGGSEAAHPGAITADRATPFHHQSAFIRFRPYGAEGSLDGKNPLRESALAV
ncbi:MAG: hypothetical protein QOH79_1234 [Acidimicrobiaceae bacterium]